MTVFIHPCMGQGFCPLAPQLNVLAPAAALPDAAGAEGASSGPAVALAAAVAVALAGAVAFCVAAAVAVGAAVAVAVGTEAAVVLVSGAAVAPAPSFSPPQAGAKSAVAAMAAARPRVMLVLMNAPWW